jgi:hypothetical protein
MNNKYLSVAFMCGTVLVVVGAIMYAMINLPIHDAAPYIYTAGGVIVAICQVLMPRMMTTLALRRLHRQQMFAGVILAISGFVMFLFPYDNKWILCLTFAAVIELYTAYRIPYLEKKEQNKQ